MRRVFRSPSPAPRSSVCHRQSTGPSVRVRRAQNPLLEIRTSELSPSLWPLLYVLVLPTSGEFMRRLPQLKNLIIIRRRRARGIIPWPFRHHFLLKRRLASRRTGETFRLRRVRGTRRQKWFARGETPDNLCQLWEHKLFPRFQVGPSVRVRLSRRVYLGVRRRDDRLFTTGGAVEPERRGENEQPNMQEVTVGGQSILEAREEGGTREEPEEAAGGKFFSVTHLKLESGV